MFTWGSKFFFGLMTGSLIGAIFYGLVTGGDPIGVFSLGYKGGVGEHLGYTILLFVTVCLFILGLLSVIVRDGDADVMALRLGVDVVPSVTPPVDPSYWGPIAAFGVASLILGLALSEGVFFILGVAVLAIVALMWTVLAWSDRATGDPAVNQVVRSRVLGPFEVPMLSMLAIAVVAVGVSRVFIAVPATWAVVAGAVLTLFVFGSAVLISKANLKRNVIAGIVAVGALAVLAGGIIGAAVGERDFEHHDEGGDHSGEEG